MRRNYYTIFILMPVLLLSSVVARPTRVKRVSDQRLAELETLVALSKMSGKLVTVPLGMGRVDPAKIGRRRRAESGGLMERLYIFNNELEDADTNTYNEDLEKLFEED